MDSLKQKLLLEYMLSSGDVFALTMPIIKTEYFDPELKRAVEFITGYHDIYRAVPSPAQLSAESGVDFKLHELTRDSIDYCLREVEKFCKNKAMELAIFEGARLMNRAEEDAVDINFGLIEQNIKDAVTISLHKSAGVNFFDDPSAMLEKLRLNPGISTKIKLLNDYLGGDGIRRKELLLLSANSGGGKSLVMANLGLNFSEQQLIVLYITLELPVEMIQKRYTSMVTDIPQGEILDRGTEVVHKIKHAEATHGAIYIEQMPVGTTANQIRAFLREFEIKNKCVPDVLIVDYLDLMGANSAVSAENVFEKDKQSTEQLRQIIIDYDMVGITASQQNRTAATADAAELSHASIAGGISKVNTVDVYMSIIFNDLMKAKGEMAFLLLKTRSSDGVGKMVHVNFVSSSLRVVDSYVATGEDEGLRIKTKQPDDKQNLMDRNRKRLASSERKSDILSMFSDITG